ncbi:MAG: anti-sigma factor antagonist [Chitinophagaceae bacterium]|nr:MAG: anti-sigma factor antagonist [Chitinophagaceae bacterium]
MQVKIDTREKFHVITIREPKLAANMTAELDEYLLPFVEDQIRNVVINCEDIREMDSAAGEQLLKIQQHFYDQQCSFVICNLQPAAEEVLEANDLSSRLNITPTESEAWDIVQMEEIERELMGGD